METPKESSAASQVGMLTTAVGCVLAAFAFLMV